MEKYTEAELQAMMNSLVDWIYISTLEAECNNKRQMFIAMLKGNYLKDADIDKYVSKYFDEPAEAFQNGCNLAKQVMEILLNYEV